MSISKTNNYKYTFIFMLLFSLFFVPAYFLNDNNRNVDDTSYLSHAFTLGIDFDMDYSNEVATRFNKDRTIPSHFIGTGAMVAPFVAIFSIIDRIQNHDVINNRHKYFSSWSYLGFLFGISFWFLLGVYLLFYVVDKIFKLDLFIYILAIFGSGIIYYVLGRFMMTHGMEFFASSLTIYSTYKYFKEDSKYQMIFLALIGFSVVLNFWIRPSNYQILLLPFVMYLFLSIYYKTNISYKKIIYMILSIGVFLIPFFIFNNYYFHNIIPTSEEVYVKSHFDKMGMPKGILPKIYFVILLLPNIIPLVFSSEVGLLYSSPVIILGFAGLVTIVFNIYKVYKVKTLIFLILLFLLFAFPIAIILVWKTTASDYGYRYIYSLIPISVIGFGYLYMIIKDKLLLKTAMIAILIVGILSVFFYKTTPALSITPQVNVFGKYHLASLKGYELNMITELANYKTWILAGGKTYIGFIVAPYALKTDLVNIVPKPIRDKYIKRFKNISKSIYIQTILLLLLWMAIGYLFDRRIKNEINNTNTLL